ncbi:MAG: GNAT family N-acetyltransferase [Mizugakiibacter sp.]|uniref:GNAT family N-acetyltransferase n=1 Tax=Mizugakiibacter sp. TaxID=1972610 RepID=UPI0031BF9E19|nr:GNAT family N-acetyltransferase [Xanthomonadaceae bacterium]
MPEPTRTFLASDRLGWRRWHTDDLPLAVSLWGDAQVARFIHADGAPDAAAIAARLAREIDTQRTHGYQYWPLFLREGDAFVGCCGLRPYRPEAGIAEWGVHLQPAYWRRGLAEEAGRATIAYAFDVLGLQALFAGHHPHNDASRRMLEKLGFRYTHAELYPPTGLQHPSYLLARAP